MGRPKARAKHFDVIDAKGSFARSQAIGKPDWKLVALTLGQRPHDPPSWAVLACMELYNSELLEGSRASKDGGELTGMVIGLLLDRIIELYHAEELLAEENTGKNVWQQTDDGRPVYVRPSFDRLAIMACKEAGVLADALDDANRDAIRPIRNAWDDEQVQSELKEEDAVHYLEGWAPTPRIERVISDLALEAVGVPVNISQALWVSSRR